MTNKEKIIAYVENYAPIAQKEMNSYGIPASITLAQGILESGMGFGRLAVEGNNHFGIKCHRDWNGKRIYHDDDKKGECFRVYKDPEISFRDHSLFLSERSRYAFLFDIKISEYKAWAKGLKKAGYATDPKYPEKLISLIERFDLTRFDKKNTMASKKKKKSKIQMVHTVIKGDTLYSVSKKYNVSIESIVKLNEIEDQTIYLGQSLTIPNP
jgi:flagellum-specific peptidoglycan hydrolase FlgJ